MLEMADANAGGLGVRLVLHTPRPDQRHATIPKMLIDLKSPIKAFFRVLNEYRGFPRCTVFGCGLE